MKIYLSNCRGHEQIKNMRKNRQMFLHLEAYFRQISDLDLYQDDRQPDIHS